MATIEEVKEFCEERIEETKENKILLCKNDPNSYMAGMYDGEVDGYKAVLDLINGELE